MTDKNMNWALLQELIMPKNKTVIWDKLIITFGSNVAIFLSLLVDKAVGSDVKWTEWTKAERMMTGLSVNQQYYIIKKLKKQNVIRTKTSGTKQKMFFRIHWERLLNLITEAQIRNYSQFEPCDSRSENEGLQGKQSIDRQEKNVLGSSYRKNLPTIRKNSGMNNKRRYIYNLSNNQRLFSRSYIKDTSGDLEQNEENNPPKKSPKENIPPKEHKMVELWNRQKYVRKHRISSKSYQKAAGFFDKLKKGKMFKNKGEELSEDWMKDRNIPPELLSKKWTTNEIRIAVKRLGKLFNPNYWPGNKWDLPKDLFALIFNSVSRKSMFLNVWVHGVSKLEKVRKTKIVNEQLNSMFHKNLFKYVLKNIFDEKKLTTKNIKQLGLGLDTIGFFYEGVEKHFTPIIRRNISSPISLLKQYISWLENQRWITKIRPALLDAESDTFAQFVEEQNKFYGISIIDGKVIT